MNKAAEIIQKTVFNTGDRYVIEKNKKLLFLFLAAGWMKMDPQRILNELNLETWKTRVNAGIIQQYEYDLMVQAEKGGDCDVCRKPWKKEEIKIDGKIVTWYYRPACKCYQRCIYCGRFLIVETKERMTGCRYCHDIECWRLIQSSKETPDGEVRKGRYRKCKGILELKIPDHGGYTVYECNQCGYTVKHEIIV